MITLGHRMSVLCNIDQADDWAFNQFLRCQEAHAHTAWLKPMVTASNTGAGHIEFMSARRQCPPYSRSTLHSQVSQSGWLKEHTVVRCLQC